MALPPEKISELKQIIHSQLSQMDIQSRIKDVLNTSMQNDAGGQLAHLREEDLLEALRKKGVIDDVMQQLQFETTHNMSNSENVAPMTNAEEMKPATHYIDKDSRLSAKQTYRGNVDPTRRYLFLQILGGKAFLEHLQDTEILPGHSTGPTFTLHLCFRGQRFKSRTVPCACEPNIKEGFLLEMHKESAGDASKMADNSSLLSMCDPVHLVLIKQEPTGDTVLVSSHFLEWRPVLAAPNMRCTMTVEMMGIGAETKVPVGILEARLEIIPHSTDGLLEDAVTTQVHLERTRQAERERLFLVYAKQWWKEYLQIRVTHKDRLVKIFAQDENSNNRPVSSFVQPMRAGRLLDTPRQAARFVSLLGYEKAAALGGGERAEMWATMHAFLVRNKGDCENHAVLLCSLLLGFGLEAYICVGTKSKGVPHAWVLTVSADGLIMFWESLTGHRYVHRTVNPDDPPSVPQPKATYPYKTIGCVFNNECFYANSQPSDSVELCSFEFTDQAKWKAMSGDALRSVCTPGLMPAWPTLPPLCGNPLDSGLVSNDLEREIRALVLEYRRDQGLSTVWDDNLSYLLTPALASYENERLTGVSAGNEEFQQAIRRAVPDGHTFKGYPIQFVHRNARKAFSACLKSPVCEEIVNCRGDHVRLALRVRVYTYPESACATWIMFACKYKSVL